MLLMAKKPTKKPARKGKPLYVWISEALRKQLDALAESTRRQVTTEVTIALEEYLTRHGFWPPSEG